MKKISSVGLVLNINKEKTFQVASKVIDWLQDKDINIFIEEKAAKQMSKKHKKASFSKLRESSDLIILFGGDGTFLYTARNFIGTEIPILGINMGRLGFLTEIEINEIEETLQKLISGNCKIEKRMLLKTKVKRDNKIVFESFALNDTVVNRGANARMIGIDLYINNKQVNSYRADGLIAATPTGSTAYSLSAGGPIVNPCLRALIITPICPHTLYVRPLVISDQEIVKIIVSGENHEMKITTDGNDSFSLITGDMIIVEAAKKDISLVTLPDRTFYDILHEKMRSGLV